ncbi:MAG: hypothetical protein PF444_08130 [Bacteroidales bacterium]|jgi:hypothetical protein|nr:hypothetical protein [Bacteroidales bacterium]
MNNKIMTYFGTLEKSENLVPITIPDGLDALVYESESPFLGYYDDYPGKHNDATYLYLAVDSHQNFVELHRIILQVYALHEDCMDMDYAKLDIKHSEVYAIRLRAFKDLSKVPMIQKTLAGLGVQFTQKNTRSESGCRTRIAKYFSVQELEEDIWLDEKVGNHAYIKLPKRIELEEFKTIVGKVRNNWEGFSFDAGLAALCLEDEVIEMARIYSKHVNEKDYLKDLKKVFLSAF